MEELKELVDKLTHAYQDRLVSVVLYGSGAAGDHDANFSDLNVLCVLKQITPRELGEGEPILVWWRGQGNPSPLLMTEEEAHNSADSFPIEFRDMQHHRRVLHGVDVIADLRVDTRHYRTQVEHELRAKLLRLRQQGAQVLSDPAALLKLCVDSVATFCTLGRHALAAGGIEVTGGRRDAVHRLREKLAAPSGPQLSPMDVLLDLREGKTGADHVLETHDSVELFAQYLEFIRRMVEYVDRMEDQK